MAEEAMAFTFGDPEPVLNTRTLFDMLECVSNGRWYYPPLSLDGIASSFHASPHHSSAIQLKRNLIVGAFKPSKYISREAMRGLVQDYLIFGNAYPLRIDNMLGSPLRLDYRLAKYMRRGIKNDWYYLRGWNDEEIIPDHNVLHLRQMDINQDVYGIPEYISAMNAMLLNEAATLFRRKYYQNGSHAGYLLYATGEFAPGEIENIRDQLRLARGPGNFRNMLIHAPQGKVDGLKLIPVADVSAKDEFLNIKNLSRDDIMAAHRVPPQLLGIVPSNAGGFGKVTDAAAIFYELEIQPLMREFEAINDFLGVQAVTWQPFSIGLKK